MKNLSRLLIFILCVPLLARLFIKPDVQAEKREKKPEDEELLFMVAIDEDKGSFWCEPERAVAYMVAAIVPWETLSGEPASDWARQEYLKALAVLCRTNLMYAWQQKGSPPFLSMEDCGLYMKRLRADSPRLDEIRSAVEFTRGAVMADENNAVIAAPFFTSSDWDIRMRSAGDGCGFSLNYGVLMANDGMSFAELLNGFFENIKIVVMYK
ncbi:MAG: SpoIID/LytB domain-containing protein [Roseburia sp.]|nr:SpoIID/LytB domain-containing protein [Roseburia sp.]